MLNSILKFSLALFIALSSESQGMIPTSRLKSGDVLLISLNCYTCALIERSTNGPYSHSGIVLHHQGEWMVAQALGPVHLILLNKFLAQRRSGSTIAHLRAHSKFSEAELTTAYQKFHGIPFDPDYLWDDEKLYCSEFVAKFFNELEPESLGTRPIEYGEYDEIWRNLLGPRYNGGAPGNSPVSLLHDSFFKVIDFY